MAEQKRSSRLQPVARLAEDKQQKAARRLGDIRQKLQQQRQQLQELESYRVEYLDRLHDAARNGIKAAQLRHYQSFVSKLSEAIEQQQKVVLMAERDVGTALDNWFQTRNRMKMVDSVVSNCHVEELQGELRSEQRETDERAQRSSGGQILPA